VDQIDNDIGEPGNDTKDDRVCSGLIGDPKGWLAPTPPPTLSGYIPKHNALAEKAINNLAGWGKFTFTPVYSNNKYKLPSSPTGARVVLADKTGKQCINGGEFYYQDWKAEKFNEETYVRTGVLLGNLKPGSRKGCLDVKVLRHHGLTPDQVHNNPMFFHRMLFPFCNLSESGVESDHRMPYFSNVSVFTNMYVMWKGAGSRYGHDLAPVVIPELVHWTAVPLRNGASDGKIATLFHCWKEDDPRYNPVIANNIQKQQWWQIKQYIKLSMGIKEKRRGLPGYNPCVKYDYMYCCLVHNMNYATKYADGDVLPGHGDLDI
jgi:hypothetical protein